MYTVQLVEVNECFNIAEEMKDSVLTRWDSESALAVTQLAGLVCDLNGHLCTAHSSTRSSYCLLNMEVIVISLTLVLNLRQAELVWL